MEKTNKIKQRVLEIENLLESGQWSEPSADDLLHELDNMIAELSTQIVNESSHFITDSSNS